MYDQLLLVSHDKDGERAGRAPRREGLRCAPDRSVGARLPHPGGDVRGRRRVLSGRRARRLPGRYLLALSRSVAGGDLDLESFDADPEELPDDELERRLLALPGVGPYAAAHVMMMLGRYSRLILDSWTRPTYARLVGRDSVADKEIEARFSPYGPYKGLAFWLYLTRGWLES